MINPIDELLGEIEKFKTNIANSNDLIASLKDTTNKISAQEKKLNENHKNILDEIHGTINNIIESIDVSNDLNKEEFVDLGMNVSFLDKKIVSLSEDLRAVQVDISSVNKKKFFLFGFMSIILLVAIASLIMLVVIILK